MRKKQVFIIILLVGSMLLQGCVVAAVGLGAAGTIAYVRGDLQAVESESIDDVYEATLKALKELELLPTRKLKDSLGAEIITYDAQDKKITIRLKSAAEKTTKLSIRIGVFGSETKSRLIYQKIRENLQKQPGHTRVP
ncbi:MAG TPA: DUF3568 family protein [Sedimentisphaerales bacterium]|nr:DUF3568 family protein [Sedimentisphaerales bacterium]